MATVKQLEARLAALEEFVSARSAETKEFIRQAEAIRVESEKLEARLAALTAQKPIRAATGAPNRVGAQEKVFASIKEAMEAAKALATSGTAKSVLVTETKVSYYPVV